MHSECYVRALSLRRASIDDASAIMRALRALLVSSEAPQMRFAHELYAQAYVRNAILRERIVFVGDFLVMFDIGSDWYMHPDVRYLIEQLILRVYHTGDGKVSDAIAALDELAAQHGCVAVVSGDTQRGKMVPHYQAAGFQVLGTQLIKVLAA